LHIYNGTEKNIFTYYEDDGNTFNYKKGDYCKRNIEFDSSKKQIIFDEQQGTYNSQFKYVQLILHGFDPTIKNFSVSGQQYELIESNDRIFNPLDNLGDVYDKESYKSMMNALSAPPVKTVTIANSSKAINITW